MTTSRFALISVWNKTGITNLANCLLHHNYKIISSGGTYKHLTKTVDEKYIKNITKVSEFTGSKELLSGRVKTLHPRIHAGILARPEDDYSDIRINTVVCNLYPFSSAKSPEEATELIDIGGPTMLRSAAKNYKYTTVICDPNDYSELISELDKYGHFTEFTRNELASKVWNHVFEYDRSINEYYSRPTELITLKYGTNPHQSAKMIYDPTELNILNGSPGYINMLDALLGWQLVSDIKQTLNLPAFASYKHNSPAGVAVSWEGHNTLDDPVIKYLSNLYQLNKNPDKYSNIMWSYLRARNCDPLSSFGDFVACNEIVDLDTAKMLKKNVSDGIIAPGYDNDALDLLKTKKKGKFLILQINPAYCPSIVECRQIFGCKLIQDRDSKIVTSQDIINGCNNYSFNQSELRDLVLAQITVKYTQSNSVAIAYNGQVIGIGAGQQNRVDCVRLAGKKSNLWFCRETFSSKRKSGVSITDLINRHMQLASNRISDIKHPLSLASDGFFPFSDNIDVAKSYGISCIVQPGGSMRDLDVTNTCDKYDIKMSCVGIRSFCH